MGEIYHAQGTKNYGQAQGDQRIGAALVEAIKNLQKDRVHRLTALEKIRSLRCLLLTERPVN